MTAFLQPLKGKEEDQELQDDTVQKGRSRQAEAVDQGKNEKKERAFQQIEEKKAEVKINRQCHFL